MKKIYVSLFVGFLFSIACTAQLTTTIYVSPPSCFWGNNGYVTISTTGGTPPYINEFNNIVTTDSVFTGLVANDYFLLVTDADDNQLDALFTIIDGDSVHTTPVTLPTSCPGSNDGMVSFIMSNGFAPYYVSNLTWGAGDEDGTGPPNYWGGFPPGGYLFDVTDSIGCIGTISFVIPEGIIPSINAGNDIDVCAGSSVQLSASLQSSFEFPQYEWRADTTLIIANSPGITVAPTTTTTYKVTGYADNGLCAVTDYITVTMISLDTPAINLTANIFSVTNPQPAVTYSWQQLNATAWVDVVPAATGINYTGNPGNTYRDKASNICGDVAYSDSLLLGKALVEPGFFLYPNPATNIIRLDGLQAIDSWQTAEIINAIGQKVLPAKDIRNQTGVSMNIEQLSADIYFMKLTKGNGETLVFKFIKK